MNTGNYCRFTRIALIAILCWLRGYIPAFSQHYIFDVEPIGVEDGLPHRTTAAIVQDREGFIWVSTLAGISRYDGYRFKTYSSVVLDIGDFSAAKYLAVDTQNRIWYVGNLNRNVPRSQSGLIDSKQDSIYPIEAVSEGRFTSKDVLYLGNSAVNKDHILIVIRSGLVYEYNGTFKEIYRSPYPISELGNTFCKALPDSSYWLINGKDVMRIKDGKKIQHITHDHWIRRVVMTYPQLILGTSADFPVRHWILKNGAFAPLSLPGCPLEDVRMLLRIHPDYTCYTTEEKLAVQDRQGHTIYSFDRLKRSTDNSFPDVSTTFTDRQGILWAATENGLFKVSVRKNPFTTLFNLGDGGRGIYRKGQQLWKGNRVKNIRSGVQREIRPDLDIRVESFHEDHKGHLWMGTDRNILIQYLPETDTYITYDNLDINGSLHLVFQNNITKNYWVVNGGGIFRFEPATRKLTSFFLPESAEVAYRQFYQNNAGIWIVSRKGLFLMDARSEALIKHYTTADGLPFDNINYLYEDSEGIFWLGTKRGGLIRWDLQKNSFRQYTRSNGLSNNNIYAVYEDDYETLWLPSDYGLMAFDKNTETAKVYLPQHGIPHEEFNTFAHFQDKDGTLYFGSLKGIVSFHPRDLQQQAAVSPSLYATGVSVLRNNAEAFTDKTADYKTTKEIRLHSDDKILEVELILLDYEKPAENQYAYKLTGQQEQWVYTRENKISIMNPPYGSYNLVIRARGGSGNWSETPLTIPVYVPLPFYLQWWFITAVLLIVTVGIITVVRWRIRKLKRDRKRLEEEVQKRTRQIEEDKKTIEEQAEDLKALDKAKSRFFTNITHEFRTPLTLISGPAEQMIAAGVPDTLKAQAQTIKHNAKHLLGLINQLLDISKLESGQMEVKTSTADIVAFTRELVQVFESRTAEKQQQLLFHSAAETWKTHFDREKYSEIVYNLLSNAIKYSPEKATVMLSLSKIESADKAYIGIEVKDTGIGITPEALLHIFDRFYQVDDSATRSGEGTGIGLALVKELVELMDGKITVESQPGKGSVFTVTLPVLPPPQDQDTAAEPLASKPPAVISEVETELTGVQNPNTSEAGKLELLIIEDNPQMRAYIRSCIDLSLYRVSEAADGLAGIAKAQEIVPDLIISDVMMPKKDGFEVTRAIRSHIATSHIPLILLTAKASEESRLEGISRGADAYLTKPFSPKELNLRIKKLIELRQLLQKRYQNPETHPDQNTVFKKEDRFISELKAYITDRISEPDLNVETISRHFSMSRSQFYRKLNALMNTSIGSYIRIVRLETAVKLLKEQQLNIAEVAYASGFSSPSHFSRAFKKVYGKTPSELQ